MVMLEDMIDVIDKFARDNDLVLVGVLLLAAAFILSFCYRTFWGQWKDRSRDDQIYGKPRK